MKDVFFAKPFLDFYSLHVIEENSFFYPFLLIEHNGFKSMSSLGYQGPFWKRVPGLLEIEEFVASRAEFIREHDIVCEFIRFNPFLENQSLLMQIYNIERSSVFYMIDVNEDPEKYFKSLPNRTRTIISKSSEDCVFVSKKVGILERSLEFGNEFFRDVDSIKHIVESEFAIQLVYMLNNVEEASSLFFVSEDNAYYIANVSSETGKNRGANVALLLEFYKYALKKNIKRIGLGGGVTDGDSLSIFKKQFSTREARTLHMKLIHNEGLYFKANENKKEGFFPPYLNGLNLLNFRLPPQRL